MLIDIIFLAIIVFSIIRGTKKGIIKTVLGLSSFFVSIVAALMLYDPFMDSVSKNAAIAQWLAGFKECIKDVVLPVIDLETLIEEGGALKYIIGKEALAQGANAIASAVAEAVVYLITVILFIILIKLLVNLLFGVFKVAAKMPVIKQANGLIGGALGLVSGILICWIASAVMSLCVGQPGFAWVTESINTSILAKYLFESNIIFAILK
ncbi:MAG: CvpA family protein [Clostridia bacterium]|nr:CvpA family protein [Clostridia bacterium]